jgi:hypothetical protein
MANPCSGSDVAANFLATLSAAVVQRPLLALKMSTALLTPAHAQRISAHPQQLKAPPSKQHMPHTLPHHTVLQYQNKTAYALPAEPPANTANPCSGSDVAERSFLATLSAAVVQRPLVALKMSTALL